MKKLWILVLGFGTITISSCSEQRETTEAAATETVVTDTETEMDATATTNYDMEYNDRADRISSQMAADLKLDTATQTKVRTVYYTRSRRLSELDQKYNSNNQNSSTASQDTTGMYRERQTINRDADAEFRGILSPQQYRSYEANRMNYDEMKYKSGDTKIKMEGDESKIKSGDMKMKTEGDESKYKSGDTKMKTEGDESKIKIGDTKVKSEKGESKYKSGDTKIKVETK